MWRMLPLILSLFASSTTTADEIVNYAEYSPAFASSGQPTLTQFEALRARGFETVVYLAFSDHENSLPHADRLAREQGLRYIHIPVDWNRPTSADYALVSSVLEQSENGRTLLHCQMNYRASAFAFLFRVISEDVPLAQAQQDMLAVWQPNQVWTDFMRAQLTAAGIDPDCDGCDWTVQQR